MKIIGINGSPRKKWNTATLLENALEGASEMGAETKLIHLYDLSYKGCTSCFSCKIIGGPSAGKCAMKDDITPILNEIRESADGIILGTPVYFGSMTGEIRSFIERLAFSSVVYCPSAPTVFPRKIKTGIIYTMNAPEKMAQERGYEALSKFTEGYFRMIFGHAESLFCYDTCQFQDYSKVVMELFDPIKKAERRTKYFPEECEKAKEFGKRMAEDI